MAVRMTFEGRVTISERIRELLDLHATVRMWTEDIMALTRGGHS
jgi:hypothetical protein